MAIRVAGTFRWRGAQSTAWNDGRNWIDENGAAWAQVQYPGYDGAEVGNVADDIVLFDAATINGVAGADHSALGVLESLTIYPEYTQGLGSITTRLQLPGGGNVTIQAAAAGDLYVDFAAETFVYLQALNSASILHLFGHVNAWVFGGSAVIRDGAMLYGLRIAQLPGQNPATLLIEENVSMPDGVISADGGITTCHSPINGTLQVAGGRWIQFAATNVLRLDGFGEFQWDAGDIAYADVRSGAINASQAVGLRTAQEIRLWQNGSLNLNTGSGGVSVVKLESMASSPKVMLTPGTTFAI